jgi:hypothetical protein
VLRKYFQRKHLSRILVGAESYVQCLGPFHSDVTNSVFHVVHFLWFQEKLLRFESAKLLKWIVNFSGHSWIEVSPQIKITFRSMEHDDHSPIFIIRQKQFVGPALNFAFRICMNCSGLHLTMVRHKHRMLTINDWSHEQNVQWFMDVNCDLIRAVVLQQNLFILKYGIQQADWLLSAITVRRRAL